ncbi:MAG TPA: tetratricopeptide repeat protein [Bacteroidales bacterium]
MRIRTFVFFLLLTLLASPVQARRTKTSDKSSVSKEVKVPSLSENDQRMVDYYFQEALNLKQQGKFDAAFDMFRYCVALDSLNAQAWYETSVFYNNLKQVDLGLKALEKAVQLDEDNEWYTLGLANLYLSLDKKPEAIVLYEKLAKSKLEDENLLYQLAGLYAQTGNVQAAIRVFDQVERLIGKNESVSFEKYKIYKQAGDSKKAIREIESLCAENPYEVEYVLLMGDAWMDLGNPQKALIQYEAAKKIDPKNPAIALSLADYYNATGDSLAAQKQLILALTNPDTDVETKLNIFTPILTNSMETADSVNIPKYFDILLEQHPNEYKIRHLHVQWLLEKGKKKEARSELRTVLDLNPNQLPVWKTYLELNVEADNQIEIRKICTEALTYFPKESIFWFYLGLTWISDDNELSEDKDMQLKAIDAFKQAIAVSAPEDKFFISRVYGLIGDSYLSIKDKTIAFDYYEKALEVNPVNVLVLNNYAYYLSEEGNDYAKAERMSRKTIEVEPKNSTYLDTFAWIFFKEENYGLAKIYIERAVANQEDQNSVILEHYGDILWFNKEFDAARVQWKKAAELQNPSTILLQKVETGTYVKP